VNVWAQRVLPSIAATELPVAGGGMFPVRRVYCANGRRYQFIPASPDRVDVRIGQKKICYTIVGIVDLTGNLDLDLGDLDLGIIRNGSLETMVALSQREADVRQN